MVPYNTVHLRGRCWGTVLGVLVKAGVTVRARVVLYKSVVQAVLMYRSDRWFIVDVLKKVLEGLHHHISCRTMEKMARRVRENGRK